MFLILFFMIFTNLLNSFRKISTRFLNSLFTLLFCFPAFFCLISKLNIAIYGNKVLFRVYLFFSSNLLSNETRESFKFRYFHQVEEIAIRFDFLPIALFVSGRCLQALLLRATWTPSPSGVIDSMTLMFLKKVA